MAPHRYWRVRVTGSEDEIAIVQTSLATLEFRESVGGVDATGAGTAIQSNGTGSNAYDANTGTDWDSGGGNALPQWIGYDFGSGNDLEIAQILIRASATNPLKTPWSFDIQRSDDNVTYTTEATVTLDPSWSAGEERTYLTGLAGSGPATEVIAETMNMSMFPHTSGLSGHRYWRILVNTTGGGGGEIRIASLLMKETVGGAGNQYLLGTASASEVGVQPASSIFNSTGWRTSTGLGSGTFPHNWTYDFGQGDERDLKEIVFDSTDFADPAPIDFEIQYSDNGTSWTSSNRFAGLSWTAFETKTFSLLARELVDSLNTSEFVHGNDRIFDTLLTEINVSDPTERFITSTRAIADVMNVTSSFLTDFINSIEETLSVSEDVIATGIFKQFVSEELNLDSLVRLSFLLGVSDSFNISSPITVSKGISQTLLEGLSLDAGALSQLIANSDEIQEALKVSDFSFNPVLALIAETLNVSSNFLPLLLANQLAEDGLTLSPALVRTLVASSTTEEVIQLIGGTSTSAVLKGKLEDVVLFTINGFDDGEDYYGWTYNPENEAVTNYALPFGELASYRDNYYLASSSGLYMMEGKLDNNEFIQSKITTAGLTFGSRTEKQVPQVFLGVDGDRVIVSVAVDKRDTVYYEVNSQGTDPLETKRLKVGKGLIGNTWQFSVIDKDSEDFNLNSLEFFPVVLKRKHR